MRGVPFKPDDSLRVDEAYPARAGSSPAVLFTEDGDRAYPRSCGEFSRVLNTRT